MGWNIFWARAQDESEGLYFRFGIAVFYFIEGMDKFLEPTLWVPLFRQIGIGDWFRFATGAIEVGAAILVLIPRTALLGLLAIVATMATAAALLGFELHRPGDGAFPGLIGAVVALAAWLRWRQVRITAPEGL